MSDKGLVKEGKTEYWQTCRREYRDAEKIERATVILSMENENIDFMAKILNEASSPTRFRILYLLYRVDELCSCDIQELLDISLSAISQHLTRLKEVGLIDTYRRKRTIYIKLSDMAKEVFSTVFLTLKLSAGHNLKDALQNIES